MLVNAKQMVQNARERKYAIPHFNINNLEWAKTILEVCEEEKSPVILGVSESAISYMGGYHVVAEMVKALLVDLRITVPVSLHLDHGQNFLSCQKAIDAGFTSVMIDASRESLEENIKITKEVMSYANAKNVSVEAEVGGIGIGTPSSLKYAEVEDCIYFVRQTSIHLLAPAVGNAHGLYKGEPKLDFARMKEISVGTNLPLVLHGGTGISSEMIQKCIENGIHKFNINTELQVVWAKAVRTFLRDNEDVYDPRKIIGAGKEAMKLSIRQKLETLKSRGRA